MTKQAELGRKVTIKTVCGAQGGWFETLVAKKELHLCRIIGQVNDYKVGSGDYGDFVKFVGMFRGVNMLGDSGEVVDAPSALFPSHISDMLKSAIDTFRADGKEAVKIDLGFDIYAVYDTTLATKYKFKAIPILAQPVETDTMALLMAKVEAQSPLKISNTQSLIEEPAAPQAPIATKSKKQGVDKVSS